MIGLDEKNLSFFIHELRSPISTLLGIIEEVKSQLDPDIQVIKSIEKIEDVASYMLSLSNNYLEISKNESACIVSNERPFHFRDIINYVVSVFNFQFSLKKIEFTKKINYLDLVVNGDCIKIKQILINLLSNSFKYTPNYGKVSLECESKSISEDEVEFKIIVEDNGIGMSKEFLKKVFDLYACERNEVVPKGTGLGLFIVHNNIESLNGTIKIDSKVNHGTKIGIKFPLKIHKEKYNFSRKRILIVDDCTITKSIIANYLESTGAKIEFASCGEEGLEKFINSRQNYYQVILLDNNLGKLEGEIVAKRIRSQKRNDAKKVKIIGISASSYEKDINRCLNAGMDNYLIKPLNKYNLLNVISN